jgi:uncharacterized membrane protein YphA (DoxX/SURF4 family)
MRHLELPFTALPRPIEWLVRQPFLEYMARLALASPFFISGVIKLLDFGAAVAEVESLGLHPPVLIAAVVIVTQLGGSALFLSRRYCWLGAGILAGFTAFATMLAHPFWASPQAERARQTATFFEHLAIIGGFAAAAMLAHRKEQR